MPDRAPIPYRKGLHEIADGSYAYLQPDGSWGYSNAGLVTSGEASLLVDTLFDLRLTREMLEAMRARTRAAERIGTLVNTHANGDHTYGNQLVSGAAIVASRASAEEMQGVTPAVMAQFRKNAESLGEAGAFFLEAFGDFEFEGIELAMPTEVFDGETTRQVGDKTVHLIDVGPAHTRGDVLVHVPDDRIVFTGDILFIEGTPILWEGPVANWIAACERLAAMDVDVIVPGHGPLTDAAGVRAVQGYLETVRDAARARFDAGVPAREAAFDIALSGELDAYRGWSDAERVGVNVQTLYREFGADGPEANPIELFGLMGELRRALRS